MAGTDVAAAINSRVVPTVEYGVDPRGLGLFRRLSSVFQRAHRGTEGTRVLPRWETFNGYAAPVQQMTGVAHLGNSRPVTPLVSELGNERSSQLNDAALQIFADRMRRAR